MRVPRFDFHVHTKYLKCADETMELPAIVAQCRSRGITKLGITDHLNTLDQLPPHRLIREDIERLEPELEVYFGVELNFLGGDGDFPYSEQVRDEFHFQFAIGGIHRTYLEEYDLNQLIAIQHRHHLKTCQDPLVDVLVHPYWFAKEEFDRQGFPWFDSMRVIPESLTRELGAAAKETGTAIEINGSANLLNPAFPEKYVREYVEYLALLAEEGVMFCPASDAHSLGELSKIERVWEVLTELGLSEDRIWRPPGEPLAGGRR